MTFCYSPVFICGKLISLEAGRNRWGQPQSREGIRWEVWMGNQKSLPLQASITKCQLRTRSLSVLARKYSWQVMPLACHATFIVARSLYKSKDYSTQKTYTAIIEILIGGFLSECSYLLVGLPLPHSFIPKNVRYCHRTTSWRRKKTNTLIFLSIFYFSK